MKNFKKSMMPAIVAPVQRETAATVSRDGSAIAPSVWATVLDIKFNDPFAGDDAE